MGRGRGGERKDELCLGLLLRPARNPASCGMLRRFRRNTTEETLGLDSRTAEIVHDKFGYDVRNSLYFVKQYLVQSISANKLPLTFKNVDICVQSEKFAATSCVVIFSRKSVFQ